jgi:hypothetical protein
LHDGVERRQVRKPPSENVLLMPELNFDWKTGLADLFGGTVNQQTLEEAAELMISVSASDITYHQECLTMLNEGIRAAYSGDGSIITCINKSGYQVSTTTEAAVLLNDLRTIYLSEYARTNK